MKDKIIQIIRGEDCFMYGLSESGIVYNFDSRDVEPVWEVEIESPTLGDPMEDDSK